MITGGAAFQRYQWPARLLAYGLVFVVSLGIALNIKNPFLIDFMSYWAAAELALDSNALGAYDIAIHRGVQSQVVAFDGLMPFPYPPPFLLMLLPFGMVSFPIATGLWIVSTYLAYLWAARKFAPDAGWLIVAFPPIAINGIIGQNGMLTAALFIGGLALMDRRPFIAGLLLGCLVIKPHLGLLLPFVFIAGRHWQALVGAFVSSTGVLLLGLLAFGVTPYMAWLEQAPLYASIVADGLSGWHKMASVYAALRLAGLPAALAWGLHGLVALSAAVAACLIWRGRHDLAAKGSVLVVATALASPYIYTYDLVVLIVPFLWLLSRCRAPVLLGILWCALLLNAAQNAGLSDGFNLTPLVPIILMILIARQLADGGRSSVAAREALALPRRAGRGWVGEGDQAVR